jgi:hypothetical protein
LREGFHRRQAQEQNDNRAAKHPCAMNPQAAHRWHFTLQIEREGSVA